jgi:hypothetical protein
MAQMIAIYKSIITVLVWLGEQRNVRASRDTFASDNLRDFNGVLADPACLNLESVL